MHGSESVEFETPAAMMRRLTLGREQYCQRLLTTLLLHGPYPRWNTRSPLSPTGLEFLRRLHERCFVDGWPSGTPVFVDEFELPARHEAERGAAPDYAVIWDDHIWLIELKTEKGSHRKAQVPYYFELGRHHHPQATVDLTYLTGPMSAPSEAPQAWARYAHITWDAIADLIQELWPKPTAPGQREVVEGLLDAIASLHLPPSEWRAGLGVPVPAMSRCPVRRQPAMRSRGRCGWPSSPRRTTSSAGLRSRRRTWTSSSIFASRSGTPSRRPRPTPPCGTFARGSGARRARESRSPLAAQRSAWRYGSPGTRRLWSDWSDRLGPCRHSVAST